MIIMSDLPWLFVGLAGWILEVGSEIHGFLSSAVLREVFDRKARWSCALVPVTQGLPGAQSKRAASRLGRGSSLYVV